MTTLQVRPCGDESVRFVGVSPCSGLTCRLLLPDFCSPLSVLPACSHLDGEILRSDRETWSAGRAFGRRHCRFPPRIRAHGQSASSADSRPCLFLPWHSGLQSSANQYPINGFSLLAPTWTVENQRSSPPHPAVRRIHMTDPQQHHPGEPIGFKRLYHGVHGHS